MDRQRLSKLYSYPYAIIWKTRVRAKTKTRVSGGNRISTAIVQEQLQLEGQIVGWPNNFVVINDISRNASCSDDVPILCWNGDFPEAAGHGSIPRVGITASAGCRAGLLILWNTVGSKILGIFNAKGYRPRHTEIWIWVCFSRFCDCQSCFSLPSHCQSRLIVHNMHLGLIWLLTMGRKKEEVVAAGPCVGTELWEAGDLSLAGGATCLVALGAVALR